MLEQNPGQEALSHPYRDLPPTSKTRMEAVGAGPAKRGAGAAFFAFLPGSGGVTRGFAERLRFANRKPITAGRDRGVTRGFAERPEGGFIVQQIGGAGEGLDQGSTGFGLTRCSVFLGKATERRRDSRIGGASGVPSARAASCRHVHRLAPSNSCLRRTLFGRPPRTLKEAGFGVRWGGGGYLGRHSLPRCRQNCPTG